MGKFRLFIFVSCTLASQVFTQTFENQEIKKNSTPDSQATEKEEIAYLDEDRDLYDKNQSRRDPDYQQNWQDQKEDYLQGKNLNQNPSSQNKNDFDRYQNRPTQNERNFDRSKISDNYDYRNDPYYYDSGFIGAYERNQNPNRNWDYRENWRYNRAGRDAYLRGEDQSQYNEEQMENARRYYKSRKRNIANDRNQRRVQANTNSSGYR